MGHFFLKIGFFLDFFLLLFFLCFFIILFRIFSGRFDTSGSMIPRLVPVILPFDPFCDVVGVGVGVGVVVRIGVSRSWINPSHICNIWTASVGDIIVSLATRPHFNWTLVNSHQHLM